MIKKYDNVVFYNEKSGEIYFFSQIGRKRVLSRENTSNPFIASATPYDITRKLQDAGCQPIQAEKLLNGLIGCTEEHILSEIRRRQK